MTMESFFNFLNYLDDSEPVARFQRLCGVQVAHSYRAGTGPGETAINRTPPTNIMPVHENGTFSTSKLQKDNARVISSKTNGVKSKIQEINGHAHHNNHKEPSPHKQNGIKTFANGLVTNHCNGTTIEKSNSKADPYTIKNKMQYKILYCLFHFGSSLGNEVFYITFLPFWMWNVEFVIIRKVCILWCLSMFVGQASKEIFQRPRPATPPVVRMEHIYVTEYGMPSTHAIVGTVFPFGLLLLSDGQYDFNFNIGLFVAFCWTTLVCLSRIYLGMHTILDVLVGLCYNVVLMPLIMSQLDYLDDQLYKYWYSPIAATLGLIFLLLIHPRAKIWTSTWSDTARILSLHYGLLIAGWINKEFGMVTVVIKDSPQPILLPDRFGFLLMITRFILGAVILFGIRTVTQKVVLRTASAIQGLDLKDPKTRQRNAVEMPHAIITTFMLSFNALWLMPILFRLVGIGRDNIFEEMYVTS